MDFRQAVKLLYRGFLYQLFVMIGGGLVLSAAALALILGGDLTTFYALAAAAATLAALYISIFFLYVFRGLLALHRQGLRWAKWAAYGFAATLILVLTTVATTAALGAVTAPLAAAALASGLFTTAARFMFLNEMYRKTGVKHFRAAAALLVIGVALTPFVTLAAILVLVIQHFVEMLAYRDSTQNI